jgi:LPXTG-site transpeptidase (sortase) family protein
VVIPKIGVDAPLVTKGVDASGLMQVPDNPEDVAWYDFTARPGEGGNIVLSGHVDFRGYGPAVFARLRDLTLGDIVEVRLEDGSSHQYVVTQSVAYEAQGAPIEEIVGPTSRETVTLITCDGTFNGASSGYSHRLVVRAERF